MKIIFLDFDGVIVTAHTRYNAGDPYCVHALNRVIKETDAKIVVSSSWRVGCTIEELRSELEGWGVEGEVLGKTPFARFDGRRGNEIQEWLDAHPDVTAFVILDDDADMVHLMHLLVKTDAIHGMDHQHAEKAIQILGAQNEPSASVTTNPKE